MHRTRTIVIASSNVAPNVRTLRSDRIVRRLATVLPACACMIARSADAHIVVDLPRYACARRAPCESTGAFLIDVGDAERVPARIRAPCPARAATRAASSEERGPGPERIQAGRPASSPASGTVGATANQSAISGNTHIQRGGRKPRAERIASARERREAASARHWGSGHLPQSVPQPAPVERGRQPCSIVAMSA